MVSAIAFQQGLVPAISCQSAKRTENDNKIIEKNDFI